MTDYTLPLKNNKANYCRNILIVIEAQNFCDSCGKPRVVLSVDSSEGEYGPGRICLYCINNAFNAYTKKAASNK